MPYTELERVLLNYRLYASCADYDETISLPPMGSPRRRLDRSGRCGGHSSHSDCARRKSAASLRLDRRALRLGLRGDALAWRTEGVAWDATADRRGRG